MRVKIDEIGVGSTTKRRN